MARRPITLIHPFRTAYIVTLIRNYFLFFFVLPLYIPNHRTKNQKQKRTYPCVQNTSHHVCFASPSNLVCRCVRVRVRSRVCVCFACTHTTHTGEPHAATATPLPASACVCRPFENRTNGKDTHLLRRVFAITVAHCCTDWPIKA